MTSTSASTKVICVKPLPPLFNLKKLNWGRRKRQTWPCTRSEQISCSLPPPTSASPPINARNHVSCVWSTLCNRLIHQVRVGGGGAQWLFLFQHDCHLHGNRAGLDYNSPLTGLGSNTMPCEYSKKFGLDHQNSTRRVRIHSSWLSRAMVWVGLNLAHQVWVVLMPDLSYLHRFERAVLLLP